MNLKNNLGFSLLELLIYIALLSVVAVFVGGTFVSINQGRLRVESKSEIDSSLRFVEDKIRNDLRQATNITSPKSNANSSTLVIIAGATYGDTTTGDTITYAFSSSQITRQINATAAKVITPSAVTVTDLTFERMQNVSMETLKVEVLVRTGITAKYNSTSSDSQFTETKYSTVPLGKFFDYVTRGNGAGGI